ncbi:hypothetical protein [Sciscionella sediminilitoris]|uniref:hypothetical protein n=1 Tax=Sciscionella sediminilitoris TaxID=1445613 RepID=UPI0012E1F689|nr:hypothetical protein [Sciscionella sp. SE31]
MPSPDKPTPVTAKQYLAIRRALRDGLTPEKIAQELRISVETVRAHQPQHNSMHRGPGKHLTEDTKKQIREAWIAGLAAKQIKRKFGVSEGTARRYRPSGIRNDKAISKKQQEIIEKGWRDGERAVKIALLANVSVYTVYNYRPADIGRKNSISKKQQKIIQKGWKDGKTPTVIANLADVSINTVHKYRPQQ